MGAYFYHIYLISVYRITHTPIKMVRFFSNVWLFVQICIYLLTAWIIFNTATFSLIEMKAHWIG